MEPSNELKDEVRQKLLALQKMPLRQLQEKWKTLFLQEPPQYGEVFLRRRLAYRIQELAYGGLSDRAQKMLGSVSGKVRPKKSGLRIGTEIIRTWHDKKYVVRVTTDGYECEGNLYRSLSAVARAICGNNRNGYAFFGIREGGRRD